MTWVRHRWASRVLGAVLILSLLPTLFIPQAPAAKGAQFGTYERWIRAQLRVPVDDAVAGAIAGAVEARAASLQEFVTAFLASYQEAAPGRSIAQAFTERDLSNDALLTYLQRRYTQVVDDGVLPRLYLSKATPQSFTNGGAPSNVGIVAEAILSLIARNTLASPSNDKFVVVSLRVLSSARSLGP